MLIKDIDPIRDMGKRVLGQGKMENLIETLVESPLITKHL